MPSAVWMSAVHAGAHTTAQLQPPHVPHHRCSVKGLLLNINATGEHCWWADLFYLNYNMCQDVCSQARLTLHLLLAKFLRI